MVPDAAGALDERHADLCKVFTNPVRLRILSLLRGTECSVGHLAARLGVPQPTVSQHLSVMRNKGILAFRKDGSSVFYRLANPKILQAFDMIREALSEPMPAVPRQKTRKAR